MGLRVDHSAVRTRDIEHLLAVLAVLQPALDDLYTLQRCGSCIPGCPYKEAGLLISARKQLGTHTDARSVCA